MSKIIIDNRSNSSDKKALQLVSRVVDMGKISNNKTEYCLCTLFSHSKCAVYASKNKCSVRFLIINDNGFNKGE